MFKRFCSLLCHFGINFFVRFLFLLLFYLRKKILPFFSNKNKTLIFLTLWKKKRSKTTEINIKHNNNNNNNNKVKKKTREFGENSFRESPIIYSHNILCWLHFASMHCFRFLYAIIVLVHIFFITSANNSSCFENEIKKKI